MNSNCILYDEFQNDNLKFDNPLRITEAPPRIRSQSFDIIKLRYGYHDGSILDEFTMTGCEMIINEGSFTSEGFYYEYQDSQVLNDISGSSDLYIRPKLDLQNPSCVKFIQIIDMISNSCIDIIHENKQHLKLPHFNKDYPEATGFTKPIIYVRDQMTGEIIPDLNPSLYLRLSDSNNVLNKIEFRHYSRTSVKFIPTLHIQLLQIQNKRCTLNMIMTDAEILNIEY